MFYYLTLQVHDSKTEEDSAADEEIAAVSPKARKRYKTIVCNGVRRSVGNTKEKSGAKKQKKTVVAIRRSPRKGAKVDRFTVVW